MWAYAAAMSDLWNHLLDAGAGGFAFGPALADGTQLSIAHDFGAYEQEYAAIRRHVGLMHLPQRGVIEMTGDDRVEFLHRMVTQDMRTMKPGEARRALLLDAKGHITADLCVRHDEARTLLELDRFDIAATMKELESKLFSEDVTMHDRSAEWDVIVLIGPASLSLWREAMGAESSPLPADRAWSLSRWNGSSFEVMRWDAWGVPALSVRVPASVSGAWWRHVLSAGGYEWGDDDVATMTSEQASAMAARRRDSLRARPVGWSAYNTARVESGSVMYHIDFGPDCLPAEAGVVEESVSFTKGCYTGQEAVARMKSLGHPKRLLVGLRVDGEALPMSGASVFEVDAAGGVGKEIGAVTSSTASPLRGGRAVAIAMVRWGRHAASTRVLIASEQEHVPAEVTRLESLVS